MARAFGSYPKGRWFDSTRRYHIYTHDMKLQMQIWALSSAGRASALQAEGHRFEPYSAHHVGLVVQLVRMPACHAGGRRFEPDPGRHLICRCACAYGGYSQVVKTQGCGSCMRGFEPHYPPQNKKTSDVGVSPSGKATDSDSVTRRFESSYPSQFF